MVYRVKVNPFMIKKAREDIGLSFDQLPQTLKDAKAWEDGTKSPTWKDLRNLAKKYKRPPVYYIMTKAPEEETEDIIEFRSPERIEEYSVDLNLEIRRIKFRRNIYINLNTERDYKLPEFSKSIKNSTDIKSLSKEIRKFLDIPFETQKEWIENNNGVKKYDHSFFLYQWKEVFASLGILVFESENVSPNEMSGMSLYYDLCPIILLNGKDSVNRRIFTLFHQLVHLFRKETAICNLNNHNEKEVFCNKVATEVLLPKETLKKDIIFQKNGNVKYSKLANSYGVSQQVIAYRLANTGIISQKEAEAKVSEIIQTNKKKKEKAKQNLKSKRGGMSKTAKKRKYEGKPYTRFILNAYEDNLITSSQFIRYLDLPIGD